ncbi:MAG: polysaccharide deacetylase family protein [Chloroflexi bacterium]|nr:polysaccharide deacetylase family protein [Chloroflexota bacterium]
MPQPTPDGQIRSVRVPILMYHYISELPPDADKWRVDLTVSPENFESHLRWLSENGYQSITLADLLMALQTGAPLPEKPIIITLDDGYRDAYVHAFPLLKQYNMRATVFVITSLLDENNVDFLSWDMATEMSAAGIDIESHTVYHPDLRDSDYERLRHELVESRLAIEAHTHIPSRFLCYPSGLYNPDVMQAVRESGYWAGITTMQGTLHTNANLWEIKRVRVRDNATTEQLLALIAYLDAM